jgi:hypothetical protein
MPFSYKLWKTIDVINNNKHTTQIVMKKVITAVAILIALISCRDANVETPGVEVFEWNFEKDAEGWAGGFADYPSGEEEFYELLFAWETLPSPLDTTQGALMLTGSNRSDDLFMYTTRRITGLVPATVYNLSFTVEFASNVADNMVGIGGSPGESVYLKVGATTEEPGRLIDDMGWYRMDIDKGNQSQGGANMIVVGDFSNDTDNEEYTLKRVMNDNQGFSVLSNDAGEIWITVGTDSGFEGATTIYYNYISVEMYY